MQSRTSFFNLTLFRKNLTRFWPLWGMATFLGSLFPLALLMELLRNERFFMAENALEFTSMYYHVAAYAVPIVSLLYAILCAMMVWSYLYNARSVGLMHTLPITRGGLFVTNFLSGLAMMLIPYVVIGTLCILVSLMAGAFELTGLLTTILVVLCDSFFFFATATFAAFITGNLFALPAVYFLLHFLEVLLDWLVSLFANGFIFGLNAYYSGALEWLSPTVYLCENLRVNTNYETIVTQTSLTGAYSETNRLTAVELENLWLLGAYVLAGVALLALAWLLYRRRRSESAGDVVSVGWLKPVFRYGVAGLGALLGGIALYELFWRNFQTGRYYEVLPMLICMVVAGAIGYYAASMLLAKSLRVFRKSWPGLLLVAAGCAAVCCVLHFDLTGVAERVPETSQLKELTLYVAGNNYTFYPGQEDAMIEQVRAVHQAIIADKEHIVIMDNTSSTLDQMTEMDLSSWERLQLTYYLTNGKAVKRTYYIYLSKDRIGQDGTYDYLLDRLVNSEAMKAKRLRAGDDRYFINGGALRVERRNEYYDLNDREASAILDAVQKDAAAGTWGNYDWFDQSFADDYAMSLELSFKRPETDDRGTPYYSHSWITIRVHPGMTNTAACLKELGLVTDADLVTNRQLNPRDYEEKWAEYNANSLTEYVSDDVEYAYDAPAASVGIIGGADGPTQVYVAGTVG